MLMFRKDCEGLYLNEREFNIVWIQLIHREHLMIEDRVDFIFIM